MLGMQQYSLLQYNTILIINVSIYQYRDILQYITVINHCQALILSSNRLLHYKNDWTSHNHEFTDNILPLYMFLLIAFIAKISIMSYIAIRQYT